ncbi:Threonylcarbamoyl-AMP synthase [Pseudomonas sp. 8Z]|uniref:L-threonylcarbamoyladenylate synthase n=1 Tax=Pseudomonas sp. 8Z TaxID=2653166 RepID=UPI0012F47459|nr:L-threonylcarbamoyladenylate synthase [Pseudomonas sp. 8Z]VXC63289.1 Threonylcarbamoyl-AMP synthase [Pseudomonas sp. 8Z]
MPTITHDITHCAQHLQGGDLVAMPTETVYGLAADARNGDAVAKVFQLKQRPDSNPLIVHLADASQASDWVSQIPPQAQALMDTFWPGPLTLVLPARDDVLRSVTAGQDSVALRVPAHPGARALLHAFGGGLVAPSANRYMSISPTSAAHVAQQFADSELLILDGGACQVGLESSIVALLPGDSPRLLRHGMLDQQRLQQVLGQALETRDGGLRAPGQHRRHYAPGTLASTFIEAPEAALDCADCGWIWCGQPRPSQGPGIDLSADPEHYAAGLYAALYQLDAMHLRHLYIALPPAGAAWAAVHERLQRATTQ